MRSAGVRGNGSATCASWRVAGLRGRNEPPPIQNPAECAKKSHAIQVAVVREAVLRPALERLAAACRTWFISVP